MDPGSGLGEVREHRPFKALRKRWQRMFKALRQQGHRVAAIMPGWMRRGLATPVSYLDMLIVDHGVFRLLYLNSHRLSEEAWRSAQPAPHDVRAFARQGVRTIINLRGVRDCGAYRLEQQACAAAGVHMIDLTTRSRGAPERALVLEAAQLLQSVEYPVLLHCKSGADRAGLMSVLYLHLRRGMPMERALEQLSWRYGHFRHADTGILDAFFESYVDFVQAHPMPFVRWVSEVYDPEELKRNFKASGLMTLLVRGVLRRE